MYENQESICILLPFQELTFSGFTAQTATNEVQTIVVDTSGSFRFGLFGVYTEPLTTAADETTVAAAVNALPIWGAEESVTVLRMPAETATYEITFSSKRGKLQWHGIILLRYVEMRPGCTRNMSE